MTNVYSRRWFSTFLETVPPERTELEVAFLERQLPSDRFRRILDLACGSGRHALPLSERGYEVTGVDVDRDALGRARRRAKGRVEFLEADMRDLDELGGGHDAVICMWQSFGYFDAATNERVLGGIVQALRSGGRLILDIYNRRFFEGHQGVRSMERDGIEIEEEKRLRDGRLTVVLRYQEPGAADRFDWEVYTAEEVAAMGRRHGLRLALECCGFEEERPPSDEVPRMQLVLERSL